MLALIPKLDLFKDPDFQCVKLSPNAKWLSAIIIKDQQKHLSLRSLSSATNPEDETLISDANGWVDYWWVPSSNQIVYVKESEQYGFEIGCLHLDKNSHVTLMHGAYIKWVETLSNQPHKLMICLTKAGFKNGALFLLDADTGQFEQFFHDETIWDYIVTPSGEVKFGIKMSSKGGDIVDLKTSESVVVLNHHDVMILNRYTELRPSLSDNYLYYVSSQNNETAQLIAYSLTNQSSQVLATDRLADISNVLYHPKTKAAIAAMSEYHRIKWHGIKEDVQAHLQLIAKYKSNDFQIVSQSEDNQHWIVAHHSDTKPIHYSHYHLPSHELIPIFKENIKHYLSTTESLVLSARDGLKIPAFLTPAQHGKQAPLVILIHGGPHSREHWEFDGVRHFLSSRGYHALSVNYRGSLGYGRTHSDKANGHWADTVIDDIYDCAQQLIHEGRVQDELIALMGTSFGGYVSLLSLIKYPEKYQCAIDLMGPVDLNEMVEQLPSELTFNLEPLNAMVGCDVTSEDGKAYLAQISPLFLSDQIEKPVLIGHGMKDPVIRYTHGLKMIESLEKNKNVVSGFLFKNEGHQINDVQNKLVWYGYIEKFLASFLGGEAADAPILINANIEVVADALDVLNQEKEKTA